MKRTRHTPEQVIRKLRDAERMLAEGKERPAVCRSLEISVQTFHRWKQQYQGMRREEVVELKNLHKENTRLKKLVANQALDIDMLKDVARGNWYAGDRGPCSSSRAPRGRMPTSSPTTTSSDGSC